MAGLVERSLLAGLGVLTLTRERVVRFVDRLVEEGEVSREEAPSLVERLVERGQAKREELHKLVRDELEKSRASMPASRRDVEELHQKIDDLATR
ncbi:MAG: phasin family protein, partial [Anaerolineae bacterium]